MSQAAYDGQWLRLPPQALLLHIASGDQSPRPIKEAPETVRLKTRVPPSCSEVARRPHGCVHQEQERFRSGASSGRPLKAHRLLALLPLAAARYAPRNVRRGCRLRAAQADTKLDLTQVEERWGEAETIGNAQEMAQVCALLCCVQRQLGYMAALHEGNVGAGAIVSQAPALPLVVSWEGPGGLEEGYGTSFAVNGDATDSTLLEHLLKCVDRAGLDRRFGSPAEEVVQDMKAKVSLLRTFTDISETPQDWSPGTHGLWYSDGQEAKVVYLPQVAQEVVNGTASQNAAQRLLAIVRRRSGGASSEDDDLDEEEEEEEELTIPEGHALYRFETVQGECPISTLPLLQTRKILDEHVRQLLIAKARISQGEDKGKREGAAPRFALLGRDDQNVAAIVVPTQGAYANLSEPFAQLADPPTGLGEVQRLFVLAPVWDCYIDGCGIPEQRCAWYGSMPLDIPLLEQFRTSKAFQVVTVEQDQRERCIEALLPFVQSCVGEDQKFTLVPILVGGLMTEKAEQYASLLSPYLADPRNLFIIGGDVDTLGEQFDWERYADMSGGPERFMIEAPKFINRAEQVVPVFSALELFLSILASAPEREQLSLNRYW
ncbi:memo-1 [Symbiodinium natans]|uniref:Memo-1 protein n=1 Tax=Symbiodinium natans TaxID=878477 RepID=A0A812LRQ6_9DINO|nr:memo-1 [Symbiodinium natans]